MTEDEARLRVIRSMCPERVCRTCGEPSRRIVKYGGGTLHDHQSDEVLGRNRRNPQTSVAQRVTSATTVGWSDCGHDDWRPGVVLDPFAGGPR